MVNEHGAEPPCGRSGQNRKSVFARLLIRQRALLLSFVLLAFGLRIYRLAGPTLLWDEGWSLGLSSLPWGEINRITALDVHPPLYYYLLKLWLTIGKSEFVMRFLSAVLGTLTVPLAYAAGRPWSGHRTGLLAALYTAAAPALVYYSGMSRMFAACVTFILLAVYGLVTHLADHPSRQRGSLKSLPLFVLGATASLYTFYYAALVIAALFIYAILAAPQRARNTVMAFAAVAALYAPWALYAAGPLLNRVGSRTGFAFALSGIPGLVKPGLFALVFAYGTGWAAVYAVLALIGVGLFLRLRQPGAVPIPKRVWLPVLAITLTLGGVAVGAQAHMFAARYTIVASPFLALLLAWALAAIWARSPIGLAAALLLLAGMTLPSLGGYVYSKSYEVLAPFDPSADWRYLHGRTRAQDIVFFNVLSLAGTYERYRTAADPPWSYALRWDPVIEPLDAAVQRVHQATGSHKHLWFVLYKGTVAANYDLKHWLDENLYPAWGGWREDTLYLGYVAPSEPLLPVRVRASFEGGIVLEGAAFTPTARRGGEVALELTWRTTMPIAASYKVFTHLYNESGRLVAQHDSVPANEEDPTSSWTPGEIITDRHGLMLPDVTPSSLRLVIGLYDPATGQRLPLTEGGDEVIVGPVKVVPK